MVGGLLVSQVLTLYTTPVIYIFFDNLSKRFTSKPASAPRENEEVAPSGPPEPAGHPEKPVAA